MRAVTSSSFAKVACKTPAKKIHMLQNRSQREFVVSMDTFHWTLHFVVMVTALQLKSVIFQVSLVFKWDVYTMSLIFSGILKVTETLPYCNYVLKEVKGERVSDPCKQTHTYFQQHILPLRDRPRSKLQLDRLESAEGETEAHLNHMIKQKLTDGMMWLSWEGIIRLISSCNNQEL